MKTEITTFIACLGLLVGSGNSLAAREIIAPDGTYLYARRDTCDLYMDVYDPAEGSDIKFGTKDKPAIIFIFGGGFASGSRNDEFYQGWFKAMTGLGFRIISIDYRLGLKGAEKVGVGQARELHHAILLAVEDLFSATAFMIDNAEQLGIDTGNIVISGSSAGAITAMQAEYELCNGTPVSEVLPEDFRYAGVMSFAGAIFSDRGKLRYKKSPAPALMLHGTSDKTVTYKQIRFFNLGFFGSGAITKEFKKNGYPYHLYHYAGKDHEVAGYMENTTDLQCRFLEKCSSDEAFKSEETAIKE